MTPLVLNTAEDVLYTSCFNLGMSVIKNSEGDYELNSLVNEFHRICVYFREYLGYEHGLEPDEADGVLAETVDYIRDVHVNTRPYSHETTDWLYAAVNVLLELRHPWNLNQKGFKSARVPYLAGVKKCFQKNRV